MQADSRAKLFNRKAKISRGQHDRSQQSVRPRRERIARNRPRGMIE